MARVGMRFGKAYRWPQGPRDFGIGVAQGYATLGAIGFEGRWDYGAIGTVTNLAARLRGEGGGQILVSRRLLWQSTYLAHVIPSHPRALSAAAQSSTAVGEKPAAHEAVKPTAAEIAVRTMGRSATLRPDRESVA